MQVIDDGGGPAVVTDCNSYQSNSVKIQTKAFDRVYKRQSQVETVCLCCAAVPGAPPRKVEADTINSTALRVTWKSPLSTKQHGQIRGYQLVYSRLEKGEPHGQPLILDVSLPEAQVLSRFGRRVQRHAEHTFYPYLQNQESSEDSQGNDIPCKYL